MSWKVSGQVWEIELPANKLIVMLAMADHADHEGHNVFPSIGLIAWKTGYSERQIQRIIKALVADGLLVENKRPGQTTLYSINLSEGTPKAKYKPAENKGRQIVTPDTAMSPHPRHDNVTPGGDTTMSPEQSLEQSGNGREPLALPAPKPTPADVDAAIYDTPRTVRAPRQFHEYGPKAILNPVVRMERSMQTTHELYTAYAEQFKTPPPAPTRADLDAAWWAEDNGYTPAHIAKATAHRLKAGRGSSAFKFIIMDIHTLLQDSGPVLELVGAAAPAAPEQPAARMTRAEVDALIKQGQQAEQEKKSA